MAVSIERAGVTLPSALVRESAKQQGISLGAVMRHVVDDLVARYDLGVAFAQLEQCDAATR